ncbi:MAG: pilus assembly protein N-terminal domain-containing protein [Magnetospirillum sp.]|nr:pilus assembly protein N-terminal domain-containing protein [Magnetospirillum sp.]
MALTISANAALAGSPPVEVGAGQAVLLLLDHPARQVIIGDPSVADVSVESPNRLVVFGKRVGGTSLIVLDGAHHPVLDAAVVVQPGGVGSITITYGTGKDVKTGGQSAVFVCAATCVRAAEKPANAPAAAPQPAAPPPPAAAK